MRVSFWKLLTSAFNARPPGFLVPPNWIGLAAAGLLGLALGPGAWLVGAGLEIGYLLGMVTNRRFQNLVKARELAARGQEWQTRLNDTLTQLNEPARARFDALESLCRIILAEQKDQDPAIRATQGEGLGRLLWVYIHLLLTRQALLKVASTHGADRRASRQATPRSAETSIEDHLREIESRLADAELDADLRRSLEGQAEILRQRRDGRRDAAEKIEYIESELTRVEQQVQLVREQSLLAAGPDAMSRSIDEVSSTLGATTRWLRDQEAAYGLSADSLDAAPTLIVEGDTERA